MIKNILFVFLFFAQTTLAPLVHADAAAKKAAGAAPVIDDSGDEENADEDGPDDDTEASTDCLKCNEQNPDGSNTQLHQQARDIKDAADAGYQAQSGSGFGSLFSTSNLIFGGLGFLGGYLLGSNSGSSSNSSLGSPSQYWNPYASGVFGGLRPAQPNYNFGVGPGNYGAYNGIMNNGLYSTNYYYGNQVTAPTNYANIVGTPYITTNTTYWSSPNWGSAVNSAPPVGAAPAIIPIGPGFSH